MSRGRAKGIEEDEVKWIELKVGWWWRSVRRPIYCRWQKLLEPQHEVDGTTTFWA